MESSLQEAWKIFQYYILPVLPFVALVLIEVQLMYNRRENEVMFGMKLLSRNFIASVMCSLSAMKLSKQLRA